MTARVLLTSGSRPLFAERALPKVLLTKLPIRKPFFPNGPATPPPLAQCWTLERSNVYPCCLFQCHCCPALSPGVWSQWIRVLFPPEFVRPAAVSYEAQSYSECSYILPTECGYMHRICRSRSKWHVAGPRMHHIYFSLATGHRVWNGRAAIGQRKFLPPRCRMVYIIDKAKCPCFWLLLRYDTALSRLWLRSGGLSFTRQRMAEMETFEKDWVAKCPPVTLCTRSSLHCYGRQEWQESGESSLGTRGRQGRGSWREIASTNPFWCCEQIPIYDNKPIHRDLLSTQRLLWRIQ